MILFRISLLTTFMAGMLSLFYLKKKGLRYLLPLLFIIPVLLQNALLIVFSFLNESVKILGINIFQPALENYWLNISVALLSCYLGIFISSINFRTNKINNYTKFNLKILFESKSMKILFCMASISWFVQMVFNEIIVIPIISSFIVFFFQILFIGPGFAGFFKNKYRTPSQLFFYSWISSIPHSLAEGNRGFLFLPIGIYIIGYFAASNWVKKKRIILFSILLFPIVILCSAALEAVRYNIRFSNSGGDIVGMYQLIIDYITSFDFAYINEALSLGMSRLIQWSNFVAPAVVPSIQPYKYFSDFITEIAFIFSSFNPLESDNQERAIAIVESGMFYGSAKYIGYDVSHGYTVPFPGIAEGWVRFGFLGVFLYYFLFCKFLDLYYKYFKAVYKSPLILYLSIILASTLVGFKSYEYQISFLLKLLIQVFFVSNILALTYISLIRKLFNE